MGRFRAAKLQHAEGLPGSAVCVTGRRAWQTGNGGKDQQAACTTSPVPTRLPPCSPYKWLALFLPHTLRVVVAAAGGIDAPARGVESGRTGLGVGQTETLER